MAKSSLRSFLSGRWCPYLTARSTSPHGTAKQHTSDSRSLDASIAGSLLRRTWSQCTSWSFRHKHKPMILLLNLFEVCILLPGQLRYGRCQNQLVRGYDDGDVLCYDLHNCMVLSRATRGSWYGCMYQHTSVVVDAQLHGTQLDACRSHHMARKETQLNLHGCPTSVHLLINAWRHFLRSLRWSFERIDRVSTLWH